MANLSSISINRPILATVFSLAIVLFGFISFKYLGVREFPSVDPPIISVFTRYQGANSNVIESLITEPIEEEVNGIAGIRTIVSSSKEGSSRITIEFELGVDLEAAANDVRNKVSGAVGRLPRDAELPVISKADADASPIVYLTVISTKGNLLDLSKIATAYFKERLQVISGISAVEVWGERKYAMRLWMDPIKLAAFKLTPTDVLQAVDKENVELPGGRIEGQNVELTVRALGRLNTVQDFNRLIIKEEEDRVVRFQDVGYAELGAENSKSLLRRDGIPGVAIAIIAQPGANTVEIVDAMYEKLAQIEKDLPEGISWLMSYDSTKYVRNSISEVEQTLIVAFFLVLIIIFIFLRDWRTTLIPVITIPISLIGSFFFMYLLGFTINILTMLGIVLAIGMVVDDAIVVLENIYTKIERGEDPKKAALAGSTEVYFAVIATTLSIVAVFIPIIFLEGLTGRLFREFGLVISAAVIISSFVSLSLTPMMSSKLLKKREKKNWLYRKTEPLFNNLSLAYARSLAGFMNKRGLAFVIIAFIGALIYILIRHIPSELSPMEDRSEFRVYAKAIEGATFEYVDTYVEKINQFIADEVPETLGILSITSPSFGGTNSAFFKVMLKEPSERTRTQQNIVANLTPKAKQFTGLRTFIAQAPSIRGGRRGSPIEFVLQAVDIEKLRAILPTLMDKANDSELFAFIGLNLRFDKPEVKVTVDREKARNLGINIMDISQTLQLGFSEFQFGTFILDGKQYMVIGQMKKESRNEPIDLKSLYVRSKTGEVIQLDNLVKLEEQSASPTLFRYNRYSSATLSIQPLPGVVLSEGIKEIERIADEVLDDTYNTTLTGSSREFKESSTSIYVAFFMAIAIIYLVLAGQFESFVDPLIILFTVPLALAGALGSLWYFGQTLNIFSQIGIIMLIGLVAKNAVLIIEFANQRKSQGMNTKDAVISSATSRFRPILMTNLSTVLGILPVALALGAGAESRISMGIAIIGGLLFATILTLYVIPAVYSYFSGKTARATLT